MRGPFLLLVHSLKRVRTLVIAMGVLLACFQLILILVARSIQTSNAFGDLEALIPPFAREMIGPAFTGMMSFKGIVCVGYFHLSTMASLVALSITIATMHTSEIETGFMDLILSRPLARHWVISRSIVASGVCAVAVLGLMILGTKTGLSLFAPEGVAGPSRNLLLSLVGNLLLLMLCWSGIAMAIGSAARRRSVAGAIAGLLALTTFLLDYVGRMWKTAEPLARLSPFRYYTPYEMLMGQELPARNALVLASTAVVGFALAYILFGRRDVTH